MKGLIGDVAVLDVTVDRLLLLQHTGSKPMGVDEDARLRAAATSPPIHRMTGLLNGRALWLLLPFQPKAQI